MGMMMNRFDMFCQMRDDLKRTDNFNKFVLSAVIVHDNNDQKLIDEIKANFLNWSEVTGEKFLFITFVTPSDTWRKSKYCIDAYYVDKHTLMADHHLSREDEEATNSMLRDFMDLPSRGSFIMLTERLDSLDLRRISTSANAINKQLEMITDYCNSQEEHQPSNFNRLISELNGVQSKTRKSFIDILIDYTSLISPLKAFGSHFTKRKQEKTAAAVLKARQEELEKLENDSYFDEYSDLSVIAEVAIRNSSLKAHRWKGHSLLLDIDKEQFRLLSDYSQNIYQTYRFLEQIILENREFDIPFKLDFSFLTINLGKIIEYELNLSILQMLRFMMGIEMPSYFNNYSRQRGDIEIPAGNISVKINCPLDVRNEDVDHAPLKGLTIGNLMYAYEDVAINGVSISPLPEMTRLIRLKEDTLRFFKRFASRYRNKASHIDLKSYQTYQEAKTAFQEFLKVHLPVLYVIKNSLKSPRNGNSINMLNIIDF